MRDSQKEFKSSTMSVDQGRVVGGYIMDVFSVNWKINKYLRCELLMLQVFDNDNINNNGM